MDVKHFIDFIQTVSSRCRADADIATCIEDAYKTLDLNPDKARQKSRALQVHQGRARTGIGHLSHDFFWQELGSWAAPPQSSTAILQGAQPYRRWIEEIAIETTQLVEMKSVPVAWALNVLPEPGVGEKPRRYTEQDIIAQLCLQFLRKNTKRHRQSIFQECLGLSTAATTDMDWIEVLGFCIEGFDEVYIIFDLDVLGKATSNRVSWPVLFESLSRSLASRNVSCIVKAILFTCAVNFSSENFPETKIMQLPRDHGPIVRRYDRSRPQLLQLQPPVNDATKVWLQNVGRPSVKASQPAHRMENVDIARDMTDVRVPKR
jgi:hypothetical protein